MNPQSHREIERKFLLTELPAKLRGSQPESIRQGYLAVEHGGNEIRVRQKGRKYFLTVKRGAGEVRTECEVRLRRKQFDALWPLTEGRRVKKERYKLRWKGMTVEVDVYAESHAGLIVAEVEFPDAEQCGQFKPPRWLGREITGEKRYKNRNLAS